MTELQSMRQDSSSVSAHAASVTAFAVAAAGLTIVALYHYRHAARPSESLLSHNSHPEECVPESPPKAQHEGHPGVGGSQGAQHEKVRTAHARLTVPSILPGLCTACECPLYIPNSDQP